MLPTNDTNLNTNYSAQDYIDVNSKDNVYVDQTATDKFALHQFKDYVGTSPITYLEWEGQTDLACSASTVLLQIYNIDITTWETVDLDNTTAANTDFSLIANIPDLTDYRDERGVITCRVYQEAT